MIYYEEGAYVYLICPRGQREVVKHGHMVTKKYFKRAETRQRGIVCAVCLTSINVFRR